MLFKSAHYCVALLCTLFLTCNSIKSNAEGFKVTDKKSFNSMIKASEALSKAPLMSRKTIFEHSRVTDVQLSPKGDFVSYQVQTKNEHKKRSSLWLFNTASGEHEKLFTAKNVNRLTWADNGESLFIHMGNGIAISQPWKSKSPILTVKFNKRHHESWLGLDPSHPDSFLVRLWDEEKEEYVVNRINDKSEKLEIYRTKTRFYDFGVNSKGEPIYLSEKNNADGSQGEENIFDISNQQKTLIWQCQWDDPCGIYHYDKRKQRLLMKTNHQQNLTGLAWVDLTTKKVELIHRDPEHIADLAHIHFDSLNANIEMDSLIFSYHGDYLKHYALDNSTQQHIKTLETLFPDQSLSFQFPESTDTANLPWLIKSRINTVSHPQYFLYQPLTAKITQPLSSVVKQANSAVSLMPPENIAAKFPIHYQARDGFNLQGYLILPQGVEIKTAPLVVNPHGGPWSRVTGDYGKLEQLLANRGYIVFQPNFRASTGFGKAYETGTKNDFGDGITQNDIIDGLQYLLANNIGDKNKLAIYGHSFGGFSTLAGLTFTPDLFQVGFAGAPPSHMGRSVKFYHRFQKKTFREVDTYYMKKLVVDWDDKVAFEKSYQTSPDNHVDKITKPLVIWAGENDGRVFVVDVQNYALKAESLDKKVSLFVDPKSKHSPKLQVSFEAYAYLLEKTLADNIGGKFQALDTVKDKALMRFLKKNIIIDKNILIPK